MSRPILTGRLITFYFYLRAVMVQRYFFVVVPLPAAADGSVGAFVCQLVTCSIIGITFNISHHGIVSPCVCNGNQQRSNRNKYHIFNQNIRGFNGSLLLSSVSFLVIRVASAGSHMKTTDAAITRPLPLSAFSANSGMLMKPTSRNRVKRNIRILRESSENSFFIIFTSSAAQIKESPKIKPILFTRNSVSFSQFLSIKCVNHYTIVDSNQKSLIVCFHL